MYNNSTLETDNYTGEIEVTEPIKCTFCGEVITEPKYINEMVGSFSDEKFCNRDCETNFHKNK